MQDNTWDSLATLDLGGSNSPSQPQSSDPWSDIVNATPTSNANVAQAQTKLGNQDRNGYCQQFVEEATYGKSGMYPTAIDAWDTYAKNGQAYQGDVQKAPSGSLIYFAPDKSNEDAGHVGISDGKGGMISATDNGVEATSVADWQARTKQKPLGYVQP